jgi:Rod binding domain-containing protein
MQSISAITANAPSAEANRVQPRMVQAAREFEAQMMKELLRPMTADSPTGGEDDADGSGSAGALGQFASEALGRALSAQGGFGIAEHILHALSHSGTSSEAVQSPIEVSSTLHKKQS